MGTRWLVESEVYPEKLDARGFEYVRPAPAECEEINRIIMEDWFMASSRRRRSLTINKVIVRMKNASCDGVILGCTETPPIMNDSNSPLPTLDSTRLLARAALRRAVQADSPRTDHR
jgi:aspartate racemase